MNSRTWLRESCESDMAIRTFYHLPTTMITNRGRTIPVMKVYEAGFPTMSRGTTLPSYTILITHGKMGLYGVFSWAIFSNATYQHRNGQNTNLSSVLISKTRNLQAS